MRVSLSTSPIQWINTNQVMLINAGSLIATTGVTSVLGFAYWWLAARLFPPEAVGIASTSTSAMMLIGGLCTLGFSTLLLTELPRKPELTGPLISTALLTVGSIAGAVSLVFAFIAPSLSSQYQPLRASIPDVIILAVGIALSAMTLVFDQAMIGLLRGELQLWRNIFFSIVKVLALFLVAMWFSRQDGMSIYAAWAFGSLLSMIVILGYAAYKGVLRLKKLSPQVSLLKKLGLSAFQHHLLNTTLQAPMQTLPLLVTALLSAQVTAWFFVAWQMANFVFLIPSALTTVLHAMNSAQPAALARKARATLGLAVLVSVLVNTVLLFGTELVLSPFGATYALHAAWSLRILSFAAFPLIIKSHYISICRIQDRITPALRNMAPGSFLEVAAAVMGAHFGGLTGLCLGWVIAIFFEAAFMVNTIYKAVWPSEQELAASSEYSDAGTQAIWSQDTQTMPAMAILAQPEQGYSELESLWLTETVTIPALTETMKIPPLRPTYSDTVQQMRNVPSEEGWLKEHNRQIRPELTLPSLPSPRPMPGSTYQQKEAVESDENTIKVKRIHTYKNYSLKK